MRCSGRSISRGISHHGAQFLWRRFGLNFFSTYGGMVVLAELMLFAPALLFALRSPPVVSKQVGFLLALWLAAVWLVWYSDRIRDARMGFLL